MYGDQRFDEAVAMEADAVESLHLSLRALIGKQRDRIVIEFAYRKRHDLLDALIGREMFVSANFDVVTLVECRAPRSRLVRLK
ncbi:hypothetical protein [Nocardia rhamnosiphila]